MARFPFMSTPVYVQSQAVARVCDSIAAGLPRHRWRAGDQIMRASLSIVLNTAEGFGEYQPLEKARFYRLARRSAFETAAGLDYLRNIGVLGDAQFSEVLHQLDGVCAALTGLIRTMLERAETGRFRQARAAASRRPEPPPPPSPSPPPSPPPPPSPKARASDTQ